MQNFPDGFCPLARHVVFRPLYFYKMLYIKSCKSRFRKITADNSKTDLDRLETFWSGALICTMKNEYGNDRIFKGWNFAREERACGITSGRKSLSECRIDDMQSSQFYMDERKLSAVKIFIHEPEEGARIFVAEAKRQGNVFPESFAIIIS